MPENLEVDEKVTTFAHVNETSRDGAEVARWAHNPKVVGSNPAPATKRGSPFGGPLIFVRSARALSNGCKSRVSPNSGNYIAKGKGVHRELESERSRRQTSDLTDRNFI